MAKLAVNELSQQADAWFPSYPAALDAKEVEAYGGFLAELRAPGWPARAAGPDR